MTDPIHDLQSIHAQLLTTMTSAPSASGPELDLETIFRRSAELGIFPVVRRWMEQRGEDVSSSAPGWRRHTIAHAVRTRELDRVVQTLDDAELPFAILKGHPLGRELYGDALFRSSTDIDLLVAEEHRDEAVRRLETLDYRPASRLDDDANRELELTHADHGLLIDLHWRIAFPWVPAPSTSELLQARTRQRLPTGSVPVLRRTDRFIQLLLHFHDHVGFAKGLLDIAAFIDVHGPTVVDESLGRLDDLGLLGVASWPLAVLRHLGIEAPAAPVSSTVVRSWARWSARPIPGLLLKADAIDGRHPSSFKLTEITPGEQVLLKAATMALLDRRRDRLRAMVTPITSSPAAIARKRGRQRPEMGDWARWALRPAQLVTRQLAEMTGRQDPQ